MVTKAVFIPIGFVHFYAFTGNLIEDGSQFPSNFRTNICKSSVGE